MNISTIDNKARHEELMAMHKAESNTLIRDLEIRLLDPIKSISKKGHPVTFVVWEYINPKFDEWGWKERKSPMYSKETKLLLENGPYEEGRTYRVTAQKDDSDYWTWTKIERIEEVSDMQEAA